MARPHNMKKISVTGDTITAVSEWCRTHCKQVWSTSMMNDLFAEAATIFTFYDEDDAILAILTWSSADGVHVYE